MKITVVKGIVIQRAAPLNFVELCQAVNLHRDVIIDMVEQQLIEPAGHSPESWRFDNAALRRAKIAASFYRDLDVNVEGIALALDLLDKIESLESRIRMLEKFEE